MHVAPLSRVKHMTVCTDLTCCLCRREASWKTDYEDYNAYTGLESSAYSGAGGIFKGAAIEILKQEKRLMTTGEITKLALDRKLVRCQGKTPENTMASALYTDVRKRGQYSPFIK